MAFVRDLSEIAGEFQTHPLAGTDPALAFLFKPVEEVADWHTQHLRDLEQTAGRNAVDAPLVFVRLLIGDPDQISQLLLGQTKHDPPLTNAGADMPIDILGSAGRATRRCGCAQPIRPGAAGTRSKSIAITYHSDLLLFSHPARLASRCPDRRRATYTASTSGSR